MWNLTNGTRATSPHRWGNHHLNVYKEMSESLIVTPDKLPPNPRPAIEIYSATAVIPAVQSAAPKHPKKRFLEAATAQLQLEQPEGAQKEDNSALMQLAEMCVIYQKASAPARPWSPAASWKQTGLAEPPYEPSVYSISMQTNVSPKAATPFYWGWSGSESRPMSESSVAVDENEEPLDLSGEETFRTNQQELIDCLVEKLCARPVSVKFSSLVQQKLALLEPSPVKHEKDSVSDISALLNSSSEVSSSVTDQKHSDELKGSIRRDLPLKKRDSSCLFNPPDISSTSSESSSSSSSISGDSIVSSTNNQSKKPAPRSCKGKRYLEFMYEGRFSLTSTRVRRRSESNEIPEALPFRRKRQRRHLNEAGKSTINLRGRPKLRKVS